jgi:hypothetical protein
MRLLKQSTIRNVMVFMVDETDHVTGLAGLTLAIDLSKDGGGFAAISPTVTEVDVGWYKVALTASHTDTLGDLVLHVTAPGADSAEVLCQVVKYLPGENDAAILAGTNLIGTVGATVPVDRLTAGEISIVVGDDYNSALQNPKEFTATGFPDSSGATCWFGVGPLDGACIILKEGAVTGSGTVIATFELTAAETSLLTPDTRYGYSWQIENTNGERTGGKGECVAERKWDD